MSLPCDKLIKPLEQFKKSERGGLAELARRSGVPASTFSKILGGHQSTLNYETWKRLHEAEPEYFPPPFDVEKEPEPGPQILKEAYEAYPSLEKLIHEINEAIANQYDEKTYLEIVINVLQAELIKRKQSGNRSVKRTG